MIGPALPKVTVEAGDDRSPPGSGFLRLQRREIRLRYQNGTVSEPFIFDAVSRKALDAVVVVPYVSKEHSSDGEVGVYLRSSVRPVLQMRDGVHQSLGVPENACLWEVVAGLVEPDEYSPEGLRRCGARETLEEVGFRVEPGQLEELGRPTFPAAGLIAERHYFFAVGVRPDAREQPTEDGSVVERDATVLLVPLAIALRMVDAGEIQDAKTEIALRRLASKGTA